MKAWNIRNGHERDRQPNPLEGGYLMPNNCTDVEPPAFNKDTHIAKFDGSNWTIEEIPGEPKEFEGKPIYTPEEASALTPEYQQKRLSEYGNLDEQIEYITENGLEAWQTKVNLIKEKYPKPNE